jgi:cytochrome P450
LPEGITVGVPCYATFRSQTNFAWPEEFILERWLQQSDEESSFAEDRHDSFYPFSLGPHGCLGQQLAWMELWVILARFVWNFDVKVPEGTKPLEWDSQKIFWAWDKKPVNFCLTKANSA